MASVACVLHLLQPYSYVPGASYFILLGGNSPWVCCISSGLVSEEALCLELSFQGYFYSKQPLKTEIVSYS